MKFRKLASLVLGICFVGFSIAAMPLTSVAQTKTHRIVFALTSPQDADWKLTIGNIRNLLAGMPPGSTEVEVVAYGGGIDFVTKKSSAAEGIQALQAQQVHFMACHNSMMAHHIEPSDLLDGVQVVPSGIVEVVTKQEQGWTYIKAGQ